MYLRGGSDLSIMEAVLVQTPFFSQISKDTDAQVKAKITRHGKKKNDKDETGNVLLNLICFYPSITQHKKEEQSGQVMNKNKINMICLHEYTNNFYGLVSIKKRITCQTARHICSYGRYNPISTSKGALGGANNDFKATLRFEI